MLHAQEDHNNDVAEVKEEKEHHIMMLSLFI